MSDQEMTAEGIVPGVKAALESADLGAIGALLDPNVRWGSPDDPAQSCQNRAQVLSWYQRGRDTGLRAVVTETTVHGDKILVGLQVTGRPEAAGPVPAGPVPARPVASDPVAQASRWQVLTVGGQRVVEICGFDDREEAMANAARPVQRS